MGSLQDHKTLPAEQLTLLPQGNFLLSCMTTLRNAKTESAAFVEAFDSLAQLLVAAALDHAPTEPLEVMTGAGSTYMGRKIAKPVCGVSILRAGASFEGALRRAHRFGMILIQRDEATSLPHYSYSKLPSNIASSHVLVLEPMLATGGSASKAIDVLKESGVPEDSIVFVNLIASRKGVDTITSRYPRLRIVTAAVDEHLTASCHVSPGLGDFGDRFYGTDS